ncbi:hypothetical protein Taro_042871 [Colocasia esculenta]|uniref:Uncharacterized protein n=1 Tax=Colocasia esculenta TaxID=4460 RepID=A0A843WJG4_COLES|nr:hypothetical protein [Colocasia esculenta]
MVSDSELARRLREVLRVSDLTTTTTATVRHRLEEDFGVDLSGKKAFIREQVDLFLQNPVEDGEGEEGHGEGNGGAKGGEGEEEEGGDASGGDGGDGEEEGEEEEEDEEATNGSSSRKKAPSKTSEDVKKRGGGFTKLCSLSPELQKFVGASELARTQVVKQLWAYIRKHNLQDPTNRRKIICDARLHELFNVKMIDMFQMNKVLAKHIWPMSSGDGKTKSSEKDKQRKKEREGSDELQEKKKQRKTGNTGFLAPLPLSDPLINFFGTGERALSRADVVRRMWEYIKQNNLQDPSDKRRIICDEKLKELFEVESFNGFTVSKLLASHFIKTEHKN